MIDSVKWLPHAEMSLEKEKNKRVMIYYAYPERRPKHGYFSSTSQDRRDEYLKARNGS